MADRPGIAAQERGPGPGRYGLPSTVGAADHDFSKLMKPAYSFGRRLHHGELGTLCHGSPGPAYAINPRVTRHGSDGTPSYSMLGRQKRLGEFKTPAPGTYRPEEVHPQGELHAPRYSIGSRTRYRKDDRTPAPNCYCLPTLMGSRQSKRAAPSYSMTGRSTKGCFSEDLCKAPGPGRYHALEPNKYKLKGPQYSMLGRSYMPGDSTKKPGPNVYRPEDVQIYKPEAPRFSLGIRHSEYVTPLII